MPNTNTNQVNKKFQKLSKGNFIQNAAYLRARFFLTGTTTEDTVERFGSYDHARTKPGQQLQESLNTLAVATTGLPVT